MAVDERGRVSDLGSAICDDDDDDDDVPPRSISRPPRCDVIDATILSLGADVPVCERMWICRAESDPNTLWQKRHLCLKNGSSAQYSGRLNIVP